MHFYKMWTISENTLNCFKINIFWAFIPEIFFTAIKLHFGRTTLFWQVLNKLIANGDEALKLIFFFFHPNRAGSLWDWWILMSHWPGCFGSLHSFNGLRRKSDSVHRRASLTLLRIFFRSEYENFIISFKVVFPNP